MLKIRSKYALKYSQNTLKLSSFHPISHVPAPATIHYPIQAQSQLLHQPVVNKFEHPPPNFNESQGAQATHHEEPSSAFVKTQTQGERTQQNVYGVRAKSGKQYSYFP